MRGVCVQGCVTLHVVQTLTLFRVTEAFTAWSSVPSVLQLKCIQSTATAPTASSTVFLHLHSSLQGLQSGFGPPCQSPLSVLPHLLGLVQGLQSGFGPPCEPLYPPGLPWSLLPVSLHPHSSLQGCKAVSAHLARAPLVSFPIFLA